MLLSIPRMAPRWLYMVMLFLLQLTQLSSQLSTKISTTNNFQINYIYNENRTTFATWMYNANTCTERVTHFRLTYLCLFLKLEPFIPTGSTNDFRLFDPFIVSVFVQYVRTKAVTSNLFNPLFMFIHLPFIHFAPPPRLLIDFKNSTFSLTSSKYQNSKKNLNKTYKAGRCCEFSSKRLGWYDCSSRVTVMNFVNADVSIVFKCVGKLFLWHNATS